MRKSLNSSICNNNSWLLSTIQEIFATPSENLKMHNFIFESSNDAASWNAKILEENDFDYSKAVKNNPNSMITPGSELRPAHILEKIFGHRQDWTELEEIIKEGCSYPIIDEPDETTRLSDLKALIERGNHKSASSEDAINRMIPMYEKEDSRTYQIPIPISIVTKINGASMNPMGLQKQKTVNEKGEIVDKYRMTHDLSFKAPSGNSVNATTIEELLMECFYGQCLRRIIHMTVALRHKFPDLMIFIIKYDFDAAYRRLHVHPKFAVRAITIVSGLAYILTRLPFGSAAAPSAYSCFSEAIFELANDILQDEDWDPNKIHSSYTEKFHKKDPMDNKIPFDKAVPLLVKFPIRERYCDGYIDDGILLAVDRNNNVQKCQEALPLATDVVMRPLSEKENEKRDPSIQDKKLKGEGTPSERRRVLGWMLCTRTLRVYLPPEKSNILDDTNQENNTNGENKSKKPGEPNRKTQSCGIYFTPLEIFPQ